MRRETARVMALVGGICFWLAPAALAGAPRCPAGQRPTLSGCRSGAPASRTTAKPPPAGGATKPGDPATPGDLVLRPEPARQARRDSLLTAEIAALEQLVVKTPRTATDRARLVLRLADDYAELAALKQREVTRLELATERPPPRDPIR